MTEAAKAHGKIHVVRHTDTRLACALSAACLTNTNINAACIPKGNCFSHTNALFHQCTYNMGCTHCLTKRPLQMTSTALTGDWLFIPAEWLAHT